MSSDGLAGIRRPVFGFATGRAVSESLMSRYMLMLPS